RTDQPNDRPALGTCYNSIPVEEGALTRRPGTAELGITFLRYPGVLREFLLPDGNSAIMEITYGGGTCQVRFWARPYNGVGVATTNAIALVYQTIDTIVSISTANPAVVQTSHAQTWTTG